MALPRPEPAARPLSTVSLEELRAYQAGRQAYRDGLSAEDGARGVSRIDLQAWSDGWMHECVNGGRPAAAARQRAPAGRRPVTTSDRLHGAAMRAYALLMALAQRGRMLAGSEPALRSAQIQLGAHVARQAGTTLQPLQSARLLETVEASCRLCRDIDRDSRLDAFTRQRLRADLAAIDDLLRGME